MLKAITIVVIIIISSFFGCEGDQNGTNGYIDGISMATPEGGKLPAAEDGPIRSALGQPTIDLDAFQLTIAGDVDSSYSLRWEEIKELPAVSTDTMIMYCVEGWEVWGNWKGVLMKDLLDKASVRAGGEFVMFECLDGYKTALPISYMEKYGAMLAYEVNKAHLQNHDGFPLRLIAFGKYGYKWAKWVCKVTVIRQSELGFWESYGYSDQADVPISRRKFYEGDNAEPLEY